jgi:hypothetical protein
MVTKVSAFKRLAQDYARLLSIEPDLWEFEAMVASGHFQDSEPAKRLQPGKYYGAR